MAIDMSQLSESERKVFELLQEKIRKGGGGDKRVDFDNMTDAERAAYNKTIHPMTNYSVYQEYPKMIYGKRANGQHIQSRVLNRSDEEAVKASEPETVWGSLLELGIETCPSKDEGRAPVKIQTLGERIDDTVMIANTANIPQAPAQPYVPHPLAQAAEKRGPGRPRKNAAPS